MAEFWRVNEAKFKHAHGHGPFGAKIMHWTDRYNKVPSPIGNISSAVL